MIDNTYVRTSICAYVQYQTWYEYYRIFSTLARSYLEPLEFCYRITVLVPGTAQSFFLFYFYFFENIKNMSINVFL